ncbi:unnamed protein product [Rotaria socialis]|uniref:Uncharacterized protein n=1 Tax=Rotaria socialis TaxID=392032 RepID=A0A820RX52_9BILA|nr:unnamed protein product [Rotaria socialis]
MVEQSHRLLLAVFCFIACNCDLKTLVDSPGSSKNELAQALYSLMNAMQTILQLPILLSRIFRFLEKKIINTELNMTSEMRAERKRISFIGSLVTSLQKDEKLEASKLKEEKKGVSRIEVMHEMLSSLAASYGTASTSLS